MGIWWIWYAILIVIGILFVLISGKLDKKFNGNNKLKNGFSRDFSVIFRDSDGHIKNDVDFTWNIISDFDVSQKSDKNKINLFVDDEDCIGSSFLLQVIVNGTMLSEIPIEVIEAF